MLPDSSLSILANTRGSEPYSYVGTQPAPLPCRGGRSQESPGSHRGWQTHLCQLLAGWLLFPRKRESVKRIPPTPTKKINSVLKGSMNAKRLFWWVKKWVLLDPLPAVLNCLLMSARRQTSLIFLSAPGKSVYF